MTHQRIAALEAQLAEAQNKPPQVIEKHTMGTEFSTRNIPRINR